LTNGENDVLMALKSGKTVRFNEQKVRSMGRNAAGVRGITLAHPKDEVIGMICIENTNYTILVVSEKGYGKRSEVDDYRVTNRGGKGVKTLNITDKTGSLISIKNVTDDDDLMIINKSGIAIRMAVKDLRVMGRATQGVRLIRIDDGDEIAAVAKVDADPVEENEDSGLIEDGLISEDNTPNTESNEDIEDDVNEDNSTE